MPFRSLISEFGIHLLSSLMKRCVFKEGLSDDVMRTFGVTRRSKYAENSSVLSSCRVSSSSGRTTVSSRTRQFSIVLGTSLGGAYQATRECTVNKVGKGRQAQTTHPFPREVWLYWVKIYLFSKLLPFFSPFLSSLSSLLVSLDSFSLVESLAPHLVSYSR